MLAALAVLWIAPNARTQNEKHLTVYAPATLYSVPVTSYESKDYVGLADVLEPLGNLDARVDGKKWKLRFTPSGGHEITAEFQEGKTKGKVHGQDVELSGNFHIENGRGYLPLHVIGTILSLIEGGTSEFHEKSRRLMLGNVAIRYSQQMLKGATPKLELSFSSPVNPMVATEPGKLRLVFRREPVTGTTFETVQTGDPIITSTTFSDSPGVPQITVNGSAPLSAAFENGGKTIIITPAPASPAPSEAAKTAPPAATAAPPSSPSSTAPQTPSPAGPPAPRFVVVIDPAHGGDERGAAITDTIKEKDVNLALARRLQHELQNKGTYVILLRTGDTNLALDDRAITTNSAHPAVYVCIHSANLGSGARIFTALMAPAGVTSRKFLPWSQAQAPYLDLSSQFAGSISAELSNRQVPVTALPAPLRPMRNIAAPALAIEIAPPPDDDPAGINNSDYQQNIAVAIANGIAAMKPKVQGAR